LFLAAAMFTLETSQLDHALKDWGTVVRGVRVRGACVSASASTN